MSSDEFQSAHPRGGATPAWESIPLLNAVSTRASTQWRDTHRINQSGHFSQYQSTYPPVHDVVIICILHRPTRFKPRAPPAARASTADLSNSTDYGTKRCIAYALPLSLIFPPDKMRRCPIARSRHRPGGRMTNRAAQYGRLAAGWRVESVGVKGLSVTLKSGPV